MEPFSLILASKKLKVYGFLSRKETIGKKFWGSVRKLQDIAAFVAKGGWVLGRWFCLWECPYELSASVKKKKITELCFKFKTPVRTLFPLGISQINAATCGTTVFIFMLQSMGLYSIGPRKSLCLLRNSKHKLKIAIWKRFTNISHMN